MSAVMQNLLDASLQTALGPMKQRLQKHDEHLNKHDEHLHKHDSDITEIREELKVLRQQRAEPRAAQAKHTLQQDLTHTLKIVMGGWPDVDYDAVDRSVQDAMQKASVQCVGYPNIIMAKRIVIILFASAMERDRALPLLNGHLPEPCWAGKAKSMRRVERNKMLKAMRQVVSSFAKQHESEIDYVEAEVKLGDTPVAKLRDVDNKWQYAWDLDTLRRYKQDIDQKTLDAQTVEAFDKGPSKYSRD